MMEMMIVVAIIAIIGAIAIPNILAWLPNLQLNGVARDLYAEIQNTRSEAIRNNRQMRIFFDVANQRYTVQSAGADRIWGNGDDTNRNIALANRIRYGHGGATSTVTGGAVFPAGDVSYSGTPPNTLIITSRGLANAGYVYLQNTKNQTIAIGTQTTGMAMLRKWQGTNWK